VHIYNLEKWTHSHRFSNHSRGAEKRTAWVVVLTFTMMVVEIAAGMLYGSMALLADGWHMSTHAAALGISVFAYGYARKHRDSRAFAFGTGKVGVLGGFASAVALVVVALFMTVESIERLVAPVRINFNEAIVVATVGLVVNLISALILGHSDHHHHTADDEDPDHHHHHHTDHNLKAAFMHVMADALTSLFAILALVAGKWWAWTWLDPFMGIVGAGIISLWAYGLLHTTARILIDSDVSEGTLERIRRAIEADHDNRVVDLHAWKIDGNQMALLVSLVTHFPQRIPHYRGLLREFPAIRHVTFEVIQAPGPPCLDKINPGSSAGETETDS
jgi:cation diffusion facilitator family transporter